MTGRRLVPVLPAALALALAAPAAAQTFAIPGNTVLNVPVESLASLRFKKVVRQGFDVSCGAAAMATLFTYFYGDPRSERELIDDMVTAGDVEQIQKRGFSMLEMKRAAEARGYAAEGFQLGSVRDLLQLKVPVITLVNTRGYAHFVIVKGVENGRVLIADPAFGNLSRPLAQFEAEWKNIILAVVSQRRTGDAAFRTSQVVTAPSDDVVMLLSRNLATIRPLAGEF